MLLLRPTLPICLGCGTTDSPLIHNVDADFVPRRPTSFVFLNNTIDPQDPILFMDYFTSLLPRDSFLREEGMARWACVVSLNLALSYLAYRGLR